MLYFDTCALKRPFDNPSQSRVQEEAAAVIELLARVEAGEESLAWSAALTFENDQDPDPEVRRVVARWERIAAARAGMSDAVERRAGELAAAGLSPLDALHLASAESVGCEALLTCDDRFLKRARESGAAVRVMNPVDYIREVGHGSESH